MHGHFGHASAKSGGNTERSSRRWSGSSNVPGSRKPDQVPSSDIPSPKSFPTASAAERTRPMSSSVVTMRSKFVPTRTTPYAQLVELSTWLTINLSATQRSHRAS
jgi:hypothetical protein